MEGLVNYNSDDTDEVDEPAINFQSLPQPKMNTKLKKDKKHKKHKKDKPSSQLEEDGVKPKRIKSEAKANSKDLASLLPAPNFEISPALAYKAAVQKLSVPHVPPPSYVAPPLETPPTSSFSFSIDAAPGAKPVSIFRKPSSLNANAVETDLGPVAGPNVTSIILL